MKKQENKPENPTIQQGWTLRDEFANSAMQTILINANQNLKDGTLDNHYGQLCFLTKDAYEVADAMLKAREI